MGSVLLLALMACLIAIPGVAASFLAFKPGQAMVVTMTATAFGLGYAVTAGCAFALAVAHAFSLTAFAVLWCAACVVLWSLAVRYGSPRGQLRECVRGIAGDRFPILLGAVVLVILLAIRMRYLYVLGGPRYVYYLNGMEIANSRGIPAATLEYGQSWLPATDKVYLDAFTGLESLFASNAELGPGVLLLLATLGSVLGLWAIAWELGLRWTSSALPLLCVGNGLFLPGLSLTYTEYRAEDFGRAVAFCALAAGIAAVRGRAWRPVAAAGLILGAASGSHLVPVLAAVLALGWFAVSQLLAADGLGARLRPTLAGLAVLGVAGVLGLIIRLLAGGTFGLDGAQNQAGYASVHTSFDPTAYLYYGGFVPRAPVAGGHLYLPADQIIGVMVAGILRSPGWLPWILLIWPALAAAAVFACLPLRPVAVTGLGIVAGTIGVALAFAYRYHLYVDATFGVRRMAPYLSIGLFLLVLGVVERLLMMLDRDLARHRLVVPGIVCCLSLVLLPSSALSQQLADTGTQRTEVVSWIRSHVPCDARILADQRTEGMFTALTGRFALLEGMGPFLRVRRLPYVIALMLDARGFFRSPLTDESFLARNKISLVVVARTDQILGYEGPIGPPDITALDAAPFLHRVFATRSVLVYQVRGAPRAPVSPLLTGPVLRCQTTAVHL